MTSWPYTHILASGDDLPLDVAKHLGMAQETSKIYMEHVASRLQHNVVIVSVTDAQDICGHTAASTGIDEVLHSLGEEKQRIQSWLRKTPGATAGLNSASPGLSLMSPAPTCLFILHHILTYTHTHRNVSHILWGIRRSKAYMCISTTLSAIHLLLCLSFLGRLIQRQ